MSTDASLIVEVVEELEFSEEIPCDDSDHDTDKTQHDDGPATWYLMDLCPSCGRREYEDCYAICEKMAQWFMNDERIGMCVCGHETLVRAFHVWRRIDEPFD